MDVVQAIADLEQSTDLHAARLLILLNAFSEGQAGGSIEGLTKLAKLDFLLRYPVMLERALRAKGRSVQSVEVEEHERFSVESAMVRYRFGPWDHRYRELLNILVAKGLATVSVEGRTVVITPTPLGRDRASALIEQPLFRKTAQRAQVLKRHFDITATHLMQFIYATFPEILSLRSDTPIAT